jgi:methylmalonyl-CoA/ethylmalonyl-CoA epimerase
MGLLFDHLGIVVADISTGRAHLASIFGVELWTEEFSDLVNGVYVQFGKDAAGICYELIAPLGSDSPIQRALRARNPILNHIAYLTQNLDVSALVLQQRDYLPAGEPKPAIAYAGRRIQFFLSPLGFIVELIESYEHRHAFSRIETTGLSPRL